MTPSPAPGEPKTPTRALVTFEDLSHDLVWPRLFRAGVLAFHPARVAMSLGLLAAVTSIIWALSSIESALGWSEGVGSAREIVGSVERLVVPGGTPSVGAAGERLVSLFLDLPLDIVRSHPLVGVVGVPVCLLLAAVCSAAIARSAATEFAASRAEPIVGTMRFAAHRWQTLVGAIVGPVVLVWGIAVLLAIAGFFLARWPGVNLLGAVLYGAALLVGFLATFLMLVYALGKPMLIPAVCCDGADALDAIQRAYSYVIAKPLRLALYVGVLIVQGIVLVAVVSVFCAAVVAFTSRSAGAWAGERGERMVGGSRVVRAEEATTPAGDRLFDAGAAVVRGWNLVPASIPVAFLFSYWTCASTLLYLGMRRVCDGQDMNELWSPEEDRESALGAGADHGDSDADAE
jgi:hypothetical protein